MNGFRRSLLLAGLTVFALQTACMSYTWIEPSSVADYGEIRITTTSQPDVPLWKPRLQADTLIGLRASGDTLRVPLERVQGIEAGKTDTAKTVGLVLGMGVIAAAVYAVAFQVAMNDWMSSH